MVTVTTESPSAPSLFPLIPSGNNPQSAEITIGCLAKNFLPDSVTFSWNNPNNQSLSAESFKKFPSFRSSAGLFTAASQAKVPLATWNSYEPFYCKADHPRGNKVVQVVNGRIDLPPAEILIRAPVLAAFSSSYLNSTATCEISNLCSANAEVHWFKEQAEVTSGITTSTPKPNGRGGYTIWSKLIITKEDWLSGKTFACQVKSKAYTDSQEFSINSFCKTGPSECDRVNVETIPPTFADTFQTNSANLTCRISNIPLGQDISNLNVTWTRASDRKQLHTVQGDFQDQKNDLYYVDAVATVCATEWKEGETFICKVTFEGVLINPVEKTLKKQSVGKEKSPSVYVLPPSSEQLALRETVTITCLVKDFSPADIFVRWIHNDQSVKESEYYTSQPILESKTSNLYFAYSMLTISEERWSSGDVFTCMVGHEALPYNTIQKTIDKTTGKPSIVNVSLVLSDSTSTCY